MSDVKQRIMRDVCKNNISKIINHEELFPMYGKKLSGKENFDSVLVCGLLP